MLSFLIVSLLVRLMMKRYTGIVALCATVFVGSCSQSIEPLKQSELERWVRAYENIAMASPDLLDKKRASRASTLLACAVCRSTLEELVVDAGYPNLPAFLVIDARIRVAQVYFLHRQMTNALDSLYDGVRGDATQPCIPSGSLGTNQQIVENGITLICWVLTKKIEQIKKTGELEDAIIRKMTIESDVAFVSKNYATLDRTTSDQRLIDDYRNDLSPDEKNSPDPQRAQACNRLKIGLGDAQDKSKCPDIKTPLIRPEQSWRTSQGRPTSPT